MNTRNTTRTPPNRQILDEASNWFVDFRAGDIDADARKEFHEWLRRSPDHIQAYLDIAATYAELPAPSPNGEFDVQALIDNARSSTDANVVPLQGRRSQASVPSTQAIGLRPRVQASALRPKLAIAASILLTIAIATTWLYTQRGVYETGIGEQRSLILADGSTVEINSRTRIRVRYTDEERRVDLIDGQALFQVAKNAHRPFIVHVDDTQVRAVGTQFDVYRKDSGTIVTVIEGTVAVLPGLGVTQVVPGSGVSGVSGQAPSLVLAAGEQLTVRQKTPTQPHTVNPNAATAWTQRQLIFENASLHDVAEEFNRYSTRPIIIDTGDLDTFHISGTYSSTNPESLLRFLRVQPGIKLVESDHEIRITGE